MDSREDATHLAILVFIWCAIHLITKLAGSTVNRRHILAAVSRDERMEVGVWHIRTTREWRVSVCVCVNTRMQMHK